MIALREAACCALAGTDCRPTPLRRRAGRPQLKRDPLGSVMRFLARSRLFLILGALILVMFVIGQFWREPFHDDVVGLPRFFGSVWQVVFLPVQLILSLVWAAGGNPTRLVAVLALAVYLSAFVGLDRLIARLATGTGNDAA